MEIEWDFVTKWALMFILSFTPAVHAALMKVRFGMMSTEPRSILRVNLYDFGLMSTTAICVATMILLVIPRL